LLETAWVLGYAYGLDDGAIANVLRGVAGLPNVELEDAQAVADALAALERGLDFADALHLAGSQHTEGMATFDKKLIERASDLGSCPPVAP